MVHPNMKITFPSHHISLHVQDYTLGESERFGAHGISRSINAFMGPGGVKNRSHTYVTWSLSQLKGPIVGSRLRTSVSDL